MQSIDEIISERDIIIESMGYFNPLILEEHNVIVTEGIIGGIVQKLQALAKMIKGWIEKLINFVAGLFGKGKKKSKSEEASDSDIEVAEKTLEEVVKIIDEIMDIKENIDKDNNKVTAEVENVSKKVEQVVNDSNANEDKKRELEEQIKECKDKISKFNKKAAEIPKKVKEQQQIIDDLKKKYLSHNVSKIKLPDLKNAKQAVNDIISDCKQSMSKEDPYEIFKGQTLKGYFLKSNNDVILTVKEFLENGDYKSYSYNAGQDCIDQLRSYKKQVEQFYEQLQREASNISNETEANKILNKAKGVNKVSQQTLSGTVNFLKSYVTKITNIRSQVGTTNANIKSNINSAESKLEDLKDTKDGWFDMYRRKVQSNNKKLKELESELKKIS